MLIKFTLITSIYFLCFFQIKAQISTAGEKVFYVKRIIEKYHIKPRPLDDQFSKDIFKDIIASLDRRKIIFTKTEIDALAKYETKIDDDINTQKTEFLKELIKQYKSQLTAVAAIGEELSQQTNDFFNDESYSPNTNIAENKVELKNRIRLLLKSRILEAIKSYAHKTNNLNKLKDKAWVAAQEILFRKKEFLKFSKNLSLRLNPVEGFEDAVINQFCETLATCFDPHTNYFTLTKRKEFESSLSGGQKLLFGFALKTNEKSDAILIEDIEPGSPAYKSGQLHVDDELLKITLKSNESINVKEMQLNEVESFLESLSGTITLSVKKNDGQIKDVSITEAEVASEDGLVLSFILKGAVKLGYISLPDFYTGTDNFVNQGCASDVAKEIVKLKKENIEGVILDLRYNGGGSLEEAMNLAGIFINDGPLALTKDSYVPKIQTLRDQNRGTIYDGQLMILVNGYSASASEIFAGMMKDYNRAYIVGDTTFGKFIGQIILPLDSTGDLSTIMQKQTLPKFGFVKVTTSQYNLLSGASLQGKGIIPDILLPEIMPTTETEAKLPHPIFVDDLKKEVQFQKMANLNVANINTEVKERFANNKNFQKDLATAKSILSTANKPVNLKITNYVNDVSNIAADTSKLPLIFTVDNTTFFKERLLVNKSLQKNTDLAKDYIEQEMYIREAYQIYLSILRK